MRIIGGKCKGMKLNGNFKIRPTLDRVKETLFNLIQFQIEDALVLDLFAGNGSLGIEALSRYAKHCTFVEKSPQNFAIVQENLTKAHLLEQATLIRGDAFLFPWAESYDLIFIDPPFRYHTEERRLSGLIQKAVLHLNKPEGVLMIEHPREIEIPSEFPKRVKDFHNTSITLLYPPPE